MTYIGMQSLEKKFFKIHLFYLKELQRERRSHRDIFPLAHVPNGHNGYSWGGPKLEPRASSRFFHLDAGSKALSLPPLLSSAISRGLDHKWSCWGLNCVLMGYWLYRLRINLLHHCTDPSHLKFCPPDVAGRKLLMTLNLPQK